MMVDTHIHPLAADTRKYPIDPLGGLQSDWSKGRSLTAEEYLKLMDAAGVDQATLVQASTVHGYDNSYVADCCARYSDRFVGIGCTDPQAPDAAPVLSHWIEERGLKGVRVFASGGPLPLSDWLDKPQTYPFWERARQLRIPVSVQIRYSMLAMVAAVAGRYPEVPIVLDHLGGPPLHGGPPYEEANALMEMARFPNLYLKFTTHTLEVTSTGKSTVPAFFQTIIERFGADRIAWGSNFPASGGDGPNAYKELADLVRADLAFLSKEDQDWLLGGTARKLFPALP